MKRPRRTTSRRTSRSASSQPPQDPSILSADDSTTRSNRERDDTTSYNTPQSTTDTPLSLSAPENVSRAASGAPSEASALTQDLGGLDLGADYSGFLLSPGGPLVSAWDPSVGFNIYFEPQGELARQFSQPPSYFPQDFSTPHPVGAESATGRSPVLGITSATSPSSQPPESAGPPVDYSGPSEMSLRAGMKRKAGSDTALVTAGGPSVSKRPSFAASTPAAGPAEASISSTMRVPQSSTQTVTSPLERASPAREAQGAESEQPARRAETSTSRRTDPLSATTARKIAEINAKLSPVLPPGKVFPIRIGSELFQLSGASISSDAPSYFSHYFGEQLLQTGGKSSAVKTLYIDRDPVTFRDIALHLQGYHIKPRDGAHYVRLFADAQFYSLPRLTQQLFKSEIFIQVGERHFQIARDIFSSPGNLPNYFSLGFAHFFSTPDEAFPGLDGQTLLRPPSIQPPTVPNRSGDIFAELIRLLQGYEVVIRDEEHRKELLRDCRYFHFKGVEQRLLPFEISHNLVRDRGEIIMKLEDLRQSGITFAPDPDSPTTREGATSSKPATPRSTHGSDGPCGWVSYQRPFVDEESRELIVDLGGAEATRLDIAGMRVSFYGQTKARITSLFQVIANKMNMPAILPLGLMLMQSGGGLAAQPVSPANSGLSGEKVKARIRQDADVEVDGTWIQWDEDAKEAADELPTIKQWKDGQEVDTQKDWFVQRGLWRLRVESAEDTGRTEVVMCAVKLEAYTEERFRNNRRRFLS